MKKLLALVAITTLFLGCDKIKDEVNQTVTDVTGASIEADVTVDGTTEHVEPTVGTTMRVGDFFNISVTTISNAPTLAVIGTFPSAGIYFDNDSTETTIAYRSGVNDDQLFNSDGSGPDAYTKVTITNRDGKKLEGTFEGIVYNDNGKKCTIKNGKFKGVAAL